jgi:hypothetical protein
MTDRFGWMKVAAKVTSFKGKVGGDEDFGARGRAQDGAVVADAEGHGSV